MLVEVNLHPFALQVYPVYSVYEQIARETGDFAILEVPVGVRSGFTRFGNGGGGKYSNITSSFMASRS